MDYREYTDIELVELLKRGNHKAFSRIYNKYWEKLYYLAVCKIADATEAENIVQDVFTSLWERRNELQINNALDGYLVVAIKYKTLNYLARQQKFRLIKNEFQVNTSIADESTIEFLAFEDLKDWLDTLVNQLPEKCKLVYLLRESGLSQNEIAASLDISAKTVENHVGKALKIIRKGFKNTPVIILIIIS